MEFGLSSRKGGRHDGRIADAKAQGMKRCRFADGFQAAKSARASGERTTQRKPMWQVDVSTASPCRAAGR